MKAVAVTQRVSAVTACGERRDCLDQAWTRFLARFPFLFFPPLLNFSQKVNSYHHFAAFDSRPPLDVWAVADDGVVKAIRHSAQPITGIMWHPERSAPFSPADVALFRRVFAVE